MIESQWQKSFASEPNGGSCVEVKVDEDDVAVRDTKLGEDSPVLRFTRLEWQCHLLAVKGGQHDVGGDTVAVLARVISTLTDEQMLGLTHAIRARTMELLVEH
jgi:hypothetical protein